MAPVALSRVLLLCAAVAPLRDVVSSAVLLKGQASAKLERIHSRAGDPNAPEPVTPPYCDCSCCEGTYRKPSEVEDTSLVLKCAPSLFTPRRNAECAESCLVRRNALLRSSSGAPAGLDLTGFCFMNCQLIDDSVGGTCVELSKDERADFATRDGNGQDHNMPPDMPQMTPLTAAEKAAAMKAAALRAAGGSTECPEPEPCILETVEEHRNNAEDIYREAKSHAQATRDLAAR